MKLCELGEFGLISRITENMTYSRNVIKGIGDDSAVILSSDESKYLLVTTDMLVEEVHFSFKYSSPEAIGYKTLAVNISDIAAMGGNPTNCTIALALPNDIEVEVIEGIYKGLHKIAKDYGINIVGGDTVKTYGPLVISLTLLGEVDKDKVKYRSGAKVGDLICVTGYLGGSAAGLQYLRNKDLKNHLYSSIKNDKLKKIMDFHLYPIPQVKAGNILSQFQMVNSLNDISDGLASELHEISLASGTGFFIYEKEIPVDPDTKEIAKLNKVNLLEWPLYGGEDYQLVFTCRQNVKDEIESRFNKEGLKVYYIGKVVEEGIYKLINNEGIENDIYPKGYNHFI